MGNDNLRSDQRACAAVYLVELRLLPYADMETHQRFRMLPRYIVNDEHRFIYCVIPKAACSSIKTALLPLFDVEPPGPGESSHIHQRYNRAGYQVTRPLLMRRLEEGLYSDYFKFTFVRNPFDRLLSCWRQKLSRPNSPGFKHMEYETNEGPVELSRGMPFPEFVEAVYKIPEIEANIHWASQSQVLCGHEATDLGEQRMLPDFIGRFERLSEDFAHVAKEIGLEDYKLPHMLHTGTASAYHDAYDDKAARQARQRYAKDIALLDYTF